MAQLKGSLVHISTGLSSEQDGFGEKLDPLRSIVPGHLSFEDNYVRRNVNDDNPLRGHGFNGRSRHVAVSRHRSARFG